MSFDRSGVMERGTERTFSPLNVPFRMNKNKKIEVGSISLSLIIGKLFFFSLYLCPPVEFYSL